MCKNVDTILQVHTTMKNINPAAGVRYNMRLIVARIEADHLYMYGALSSHSFIVTLSQAHKIREPKVFEDIGEQCIVEFMVGGGGKDERVDSEARK
jgi:hypothetical protein